MVLQEMVDFPYCVHPLYGMPVPCRYGVYTVGVWGEAPAALLRLMTPDAEEIAKFRRFWLHFALTWLIS